MIYLTHSKPSTKSAFTMIELVFVIVIIGILAVLSISSMDRDLRQEAADNILSDIRYTQHLAMTDNMQRFDRHRWERAYWRLVFGTCTGTDRFYMIGSDNDLTGSANAFFASNEAAMDPATGKPMFWTDTVACGNGDPANATSNRIFISKKYGIIAVASAGGCAGARHIAFDHWGRPYHGGALATGFAMSNRPNHAGYMSQDCTFTFTMADMQTFNILINQETGDAVIVNQNDS